MPNTQPISTTPVYATDELIQIRARGDYMNLTQSTDQLAYGNDGITTSGSPWTLTSASVDFNAQGVTAQNVVQLQVPGIKAGPRLFAVDDVSPNTLYLRLINQAPNIGQPPILAGASSITFTINTFANLIEDVSFDLKSRFGLDEAIPFQASAWLYVGAEALYRDLRAACVLGVLVEAYTVENRAGTGDFSKKLELFRKLQAEVLERVQLRKGVFGNASPPVTLFSCGLSR
jgi:hypothetical protein